MGELRKPIGWKTQDVFSRHYLRDMVVGEDLEDVSYLSFVAVGTASV